MVENFLHAVQLGRVFSFSSNYRLLSVILIVREWLHTNENRDARFDRRRYRADKIMRMWASKSFRHEMLPSIINVHPKFLPSVNAYTREYNAYTDTHMRASKIPSYENFPQIFPLFFLSNSIPLSPYLLSLISPRAKIQIDTQLHL